MGESCSNSGGVTVHLDSCPGAGPGGGKRSGRPLAGCPDTDLAQSLIKRGACFQCQLHCFAGLELHAVTNHLSASPLSIPTEHHLSVDEAMIEIIHGRLSISPFAIGVSGHSTAVRDAHAILPLRKQYCNHNRLIISVLVGGFCT